VPTRHSMTSDPTCRYRRQSVSPIVQVLCVQVQRTAQLRTMAEPKASDERSICSCAIRSTSAFACGKESGSRNLCPA
jgi:hypothetical protein